MTEFDREVEEAARQVGMDRALAAQRVKDWKLAAETWIHDQPKGYWITADVLTRAVGLPSEGTNRNNSVGALFAKLARTGMIRDSGAFTKSVRVGRHRGQQKVWIRT